MLYEHTSLSYKFITPWETNAPCKQTNMYNVKLLINGKIFVGLLYFYGIEHNNVYKFSKLRCDQFKWE